MLWRFDSQATDGLRVIEEIPDLSPCLVEGRNGVGKTVAVQLIELVSGIVPADFHEHPRLWNSLAERLGSTKLSIDGLDANKSLDFLFTPEQWPEEVPDEPGDWLGVATIDGARVSVDEAAAEYSVVRISGNEDLEETLKRRLVTLEGYLLRAAGTVRTRGSSVRAAISVELFDVVDRANPNRLLSEAKDVERADASIAKAKTAADLAASRRDKLRSAVDAQKALIAAGGEAEALLTRQRELTANILKLENELEVQVKVAEGAEKALAAKGGAEKKLAEAEGLLRKRRSRHSTAQRKAAQIAASLHVEASLDAVTAALAHENELLASLLSEHRSVDSAGAVREAIRAVSRPLATAAESAGDELLVRTQKGDLTVSETLTGIEKRSKELAERPRPDELRKLDSDVVSTRRRRDHLVRLQGAIEQVSREVELVTEADELAEAVGKQAEQVSALREESSTANRAVGALEETLVKEHSSLAHVTSQLASTGVLSKEDAATDLANALSELGLTGSELAEAGTQAKTDVDDKDAALRRAEDARSTAQRKYDISRAEIEDAIKELTSSKSVDWLHDDGKKLMLNPDAGSTKFEAYAAVRSAVLSAWNAPQETASFLETLAGIAQELARDGARGRRGELKQLFRDEFEQILGNSLREVLNGKEVRRALFNGGRVEAIDVVARELTVVSEDGHVSKRPMEAFSTGEQAFAFTQARIADLEQPEKPKHLLVLDEFGAFVAADRLPELFAFLGRGAHTKADQVVVMLPLHVDYEAEIEDTRGQLRVRYTERLEQVRKRGYCAVEWT